MKQKLIDAVNRLLYLFLGFDDKELRPVVKSKTETYVCVATISWNIENGWKAKTWQNPNVVSSVTFTR